MSNLDFEVWADNVLILKNSSSFDLVFMKSEFDVSADEDKDELVFEDKGVRTVGKISLSVKLLATLQHLIVDQLSVDVDDGVDDDGKCVRESDGVDDESDKEVKNVCFR